MVKPTDQLNMSRRKGMVIVHPPDYKDLLRYVYAWERVCGCVWDGDEGMGGIIWICMSSLTPHICLNLRDRKHCVFWEALKTTILFLEGTFIKACFLAVNKWGHRGNRIEKNPGSREGVHKRDQLMGVGGRGRQFASPQSGTWGTCLTQKLYKVIQYN